MNSTKWTNLIPSIPQDENIRQMVAEEMKEADSFLEKMEKATWEAAKFLNQEFSDISTEKFVSALKNPDAVQFTDSHKKDRFSKALVWRDSQVK